MLTLMIALLYVGYMIYLANIEQVRGESQRLLTVMQYGLVLIIGVWVFNALVFVLVSPEQVADPELAVQFAHVNKGAAVFLIVLGSLAMLAIVALIRSPIPHQWLERYFSNKSADGSYAYDSSLSVHKLAIMLVIVQVVAVVWTFVVSGGIDGITFSYDSPLNAIGDLLFGAILYAGAGILGVGWLIRRNTNDVLERLGIRFPTRRDIGMGVAMAIALYGMLQVASVIWMNAVSPETLEQQTAASRQLFEAFNSSLVLGLILAVLTGVSEEILFRGALQPVFGLIPTAVFFTIIHVQYALTPATIILFIVALGFGWLRLKVSTTSAMIAHMTYNFVPFLVFALTTNPGAM